MTTNHTTEGETMKTETRNSNIRNTVKAWSAMGIAASMVLVQNGYGKPGRSASRVHRVKLNGENMTLGQFAKRFPYAVNPST